MVISTMAMILTAAASGYDAGLERLQTMPAEERGRLLDKMRDFDLKLTPEQQAAVRDLDRQLSAPLLGAACPVSDGPPTLPYLVEQSAGAASERGGCQAARRAVGPDSHPDPTAPRASGRYSAEGSNHRARGIQPIRVGVRVQDLAALKRKAARGSGKSERGAGSPRGPVPDRGEAEERHPARDRATRLRRGEMDRRREGLLGRHAGPRDAGGPGQEQDGR